MKAWFGLAIAVLGFLVTVSASAAELAIVSCDVQSKEFYGLRLELVTNSDGKLEARYSIRSTPFYITPHLVVSAIDTIPRQFPALLQPVNAWHDTGIDASKVTKFQNIFIDGSDRYDIELWKLFNASNQPVGWVVYAYGGLRGCYPMIK